MTISFFILNVFNTIAMYFAVTKLLELEVNIKNKKTIVVLCVLSIISFFAYFISKSVIRIIVLFQIYNIGFVYLLKDFKTNFQKISISTILSWITLIISEVIVAIGVGLFKIK